MFFWGRRKPASICRAVTLTAVLLVLPLWPCHAELQPSFIKGMVINASTGRAVASATITTTTGLTFKAQYGLFYLRVPPNVYDIIVSAPGFRSNMATGIFSGPGQTSSVNVWLAQASTRAGTLRGRVEASDGIGRALVFSDLGAIAVTDDDGYFTAAGPSGTAAVTVAAQGYASKAVNDVQIPPSGSRSIAVRLNKSITWITGNISGIVHDACSNTPLAGVSITSSNGKFVRTTDGTFKISAPPGSTSLLACAEGYQCAVQTVLLNLFLLGTVANFSLVPLDRGMGTVEGFITNAETGEPVEGVRITTDTHDISFSEKNGSYTLKASPCAATITLSDSGFQTATKPLSISNGVTLNLDIFLDPVTACTISGTVKNFLTGLPVAMALVQADNGNSVQTDAAGFYTLSIPSCTAQLIICADGFFQARRVVTPQGAGESILRDVNLIPCYPCRCSAAASA